MVIFSKPRKYPMVNNNKNKLGVFRMDVLIPAKVYTLDGEYLRSPLCSRRCLQLIMMLYRRHISVRNIDNDRWPCTAPKQACRFLWENEGPYTTLTAPAPLCRKRAQLEFAAARPLWNINYSIKCYSYTIRLFLFFAL
ncbi:hypothetical protein EVAR_98495_1 [Eumeta japonica]|uniref:Uncharacterized protein n=1 Tax=Eumeta variegata TaxID=151549 RepID=A0A4C2AG27_EUMVA|nr:hypothetical protein EVAR_98495_1 [Eumeta japonica]